MAFEEYPKAMHGPEGRYAVVKSKEEEDALGEGWVDGHKFWSAKPEPKKKAK
jgi:hypothetical protein